MIIELTGTLCAENIRYFRTEYALSYTALARLIGMSPYKLRLIERGEYYPIFSYSELRRLCLVLDVKLEELTDVDFSQNPPRAPGEFLPPLNEKCLKPSYEKNVGEGH